MSAMSEAEKASVLDYFGGDELATDVFIMKYALRDNENNLVEKHPEQMHKRLAAEFARIESMYPNPMSEEEIFSLFKDFKYIVPQGSPMAAVGNPYKAMSASNCYVIDSPLDSYGGILFTDQQQAQLMKRRAGVGFDISNIRPKGMATNNAAQTTDGIGIFMERFSNTCREVAQCIAKGQRVLTERGLINIEDVKKNEDKVWTQFGWQAVEDVVESGSKQVYKMTTERGYSILTSADHIFLDQNMNEKRLKEFNLGDQVIMIPGSSHNNKEYVSLEIPTHENLHNRTNLDVNLPEVLTEDLAYLIGYMYGDGYVEKNLHGVPSSIDMACAHSHPDIQDKLTNIIHNTFGITGKLRSGSGKVNRLSINSFIATNFLSVNNLLKEKSDSIVMPEKIFRSPASVQAAFLSGYFDADGYASGSKKGYVFASIQKSFLESVQVILMSLGITSRIFREDRSKLNWNDLYSLSVTGKSSQQLFVKLLKDSVKVSNLSFISKRDGIITPFRLKDLGLSREKRSYVNEINLISCAAFNRLREEVPMPEVLVLDKIASIEAASIVPTFDLVVPGPNLFWCEGFYVHNSGRRGALMLTISCNHPEIETFINIKRDLKKVTGANISIKFNDEFMNAVDSDSEFTLRWPVDAKVEDAKFTKVVRAKEIWDQFVESAWTSAEPGALFWDTVQKSTPADIYENYRSISTNPCGEIVLSGGDSCRLMVVNMLSFVRNPFAHNASFDFDRFINAAAKGQRLMDDLIDIELELIEKIQAKIDSDSEPDHVKKIEEDMWKKIYRACRDGRRTGLGITALGDTLAALGIQYGSKESVEMTGELYRALAVGAYTETVKLAKERGAFPEFRYDLEKDHSFLNKVISAASNYYDGDIFEDWERYGRRNIALTTTAPTGSVSCLTQTTSGIEPAYLLSYKRRRKIMSGDEKAEVMFVDELGDKWTEYTVYHHGFKQWMDINNKTAVEESPYFNSTSNDIDWVASVDIQAAAQQWVCHSISKTCNLPGSASKMLVSDVYMRAWKSGCKGFTVYRDGSRSGVLISTDEKKEEKKVDTISTANAPKRPKQLDCDIHRIMVTNQGEAEDWIVFVGKMNNSPYELFAGLSQHIELPKKYDTGTLIKNGKKKGVATYDLVVPTDKDDSFVFKDVVTIFDNPNQGAFTRTISLALRHGIPLQYIVEQIQKDKNSDMFSFSKAISRVLKHYIKDGTKAGVKGCPSCGHEELQYQEGCLLCPSCGYSACG